MSSCLSAASPTTKPASCDLDFVLFRLNHSAVPSWHSLLLPHPLWSRSHTAAWGILFKTNSYHVIHPSVQNTPVLPPPSGPETHLPPPSHSHLSDPLFSLWVSHTVLPIGRHRKNCLSVTQGRCTCCSLCLPRCSSHILTWPPPSPPSSLSQTPFCLPWGSCAEGTPLPPRLCLQPIHEHLFPFTFTCSFASWPLWGPRWCLLCCCSPGFCTGAWKVVGAW